MRSPRWWLAIVALGLVWTGASVQAAHCPFCDQERGPTLIGDYLQASMVLYGHMEPSRQTSTGEFVTDFVIEQVLKPHEVIKDKKTITLPRNVPAKTAKFLVFCDVFKGSIDPYRGVEVQQGSDMVKYLTGAIELKTKSQPDRLRYYFDFLNNAEFEIAMDSYREFAKADYKDYAGMAKKLPPDVIAGWLRDPKTPPYRYGLYASLLGHCGTPEHAKLLRSIIDDPEKRKGTSHDGLLASYIMLQPKEGWAHLQSILKDGKQEFLLRYACLRAIRFLWDQRTDLVEREELAKGLGQVLTQPDMADFGIEDLRKYKRWEMTPTVLGLFTLESHNIPVIKRSIMRFALQSPEASAVAFVQQQRQRDKAWVDDITELLKLESQ